MKKINWKIGLFSSKYRLFENNIEIGEVNKSVFKTTSIGKINETKVKFKEKGIFSSEIEIIDLDLNKSMGSIKLNIWRNKAKIRITNKEYSWKFDNIWNTKWSISEEGKELIRYKSSATNGSIESLLDDNLLILSGLYVYNYYAVSMLSIVAFLIIILIN